MKEKGTRMIGLRIPEGSPGRVCGWNSATLHDHEGEPTYGKYGTVPAKWACRESINRCDMVALRKT